jgi:hypothetical protein
MVAGVTLMARQVHRPIDQDRQIGIDLNQAPEVALVPVVAAPALPGHVFDREALVRRQGDMGQRLRPAPGDRGAERGVQPVLRNLVPAPKHLIAIGQRASARQLTIEFPEHAFEVLPRPGRRHGVVKRLGLLIEGQLSTRQHGHPGAKRRQLLRQVAVAQHLDLVEGHGYRRQLRLQRGGIAVDVGQRPLVPCRLPLGWTVVRVHVVGIVLAERQHQPDILLRQRVHVGCLRCIPCRSPAGGSRACEGHHHQRRGDHQSSVHRAYRSLIVGIR